MNHNRLAGTLLICLLAAASPRSASGQDAALFRIFLKDGTSLISYGEFARVDDRVVFSMPTAASAERPELQLVTISPDQVDWVRTTNYAESVRARRYLATRAESDYALLTGEIERTLNSVPENEDPAVRLASMMKARKTLAEWPAAHYGYRQDEIRQMLGMLDEAIASLRASTGANQFNLSFVATAVPPPSSEPLLPPPTPQETIEQTLTAARVTASPPERTSLLAVALSAIDRDSAALPSEWAVTTRIETKAAIARELAIDESYRALTTRVQTLALARARTADVRGVQRLLDEVHARDAALGAARPDTVAALVQIVQEQLDAARRLRLARDRWALRMPVIQRYRASIAGAVSRLAALKPSLEDIKSLAGSAPETLDALQHSAELVRRNIVLIQPPEEFQNAHALLTSAAQLAVNAANIRREATLAGDIARAWDASSAAAGALMLTTRARAEIQSVRLPQLPQ